jgi:hypothetical protein
MSTVLTADEQFEKANNMYGDACTQDHKDNKARISLMKSACEQAEKALEIFKKDRNTKKIQSCRNFIAEVKKMIKLLSK